MLEVKKQEKQSKRELDMEREEEETYKKIYATLQGITYLEWTKLRTTIDRSFDNEAANIKKGLKIAAPDNLEKTHKLLF